MYLDRGLPGKINPGHVPTCPPALLPWAWVAVLPFQGARERQQPLTLFHHTAATIWKQINDQWRNLTQLGPGMFRTDCSSHKKTHLDDLKYMVETESVLVMKWFLYSSGLLAFFFVIVSSFSWLLSYVFLKPHTFPSSLLTLFPVKVLLFFQKLMKKEQTEPNSYLCLSFYSLTWGKYSLACYFFQYLPQSFSISPSLNVWWRLQAALCDVEGIWAQLENLTEVGEMWWSHRSWAFVD